MAGVFKDSAAAGGTPIVWMTPFLVAGIACLVGALIMLLTHAPDATSGQAPKLRRRRLTLIRA